VGWLGRRDRRKLPRRPYDAELQQEPTYLVERDAPSGPPMDPDVRWYRRALDRFHRSTYDAYPDHEIPWHVVGPDGPVVPTRTAKDRLSKPRSHPVSLFVKRHGRLREVKLMGLPLEMALDVLNRRIVAGWVMDEIANTLAELEEEMVIQEHRRGDDEGQGLAEYALILALIAIVAIVALIVLGNQIVAVFETIGRQIPGTPGSTPAP
jgi:pilus assembly protein Flp/PilA